MNALSKFAVVGAIAFLSFGAGAESWPSKPVRLFLPTAAGSAPDVIARLLGERLSQAWKQPVIVDNKPGASGVIGMSAFKQAAPEGHALVMAQAAVIAVTPHVLANPRFDVDVDMTPIALIALSPMMILARKDLPADTLTQALDLSRIKGQQLTIGATGQYSIPHLSAEYLKKATNLDANIVSFSSTGGGVNSLINGDIQLLIDGIPGVGAMLQSGRVKAIAVTSAMRISTYPKVPTVRESVSASPELSGWFVLFGRKNMAPDVIEQVNRDVNAILSDPKLAVRFSELGVFPRILSQADTVKFVSIEREHWRSVLSALNIKPQ